MPELSSADNIASPALAKLLRTVPRDELGAQFPGSQVGVIGHKALTGPEELVAIVGHAPAKLAALPNTIRVDKIATAPQSQGTTNLYRLAFGIGAIALLFPLLILISTATRLSAARREERYAAIRLVGGTPRQIGVIASVDAVVGALFGTLLGIGVFLLVRPALADVALSGARFFPSYVTPTIWGYVGMLVVVPIGSAVASLVSLRRVQISPLGVSRKATPPTPGNPTTPAGGKRPGDERPDGRVGSRADQAEPPTCRQVDGHLGAIADADMHGSQVRLACGAVGWFPCRLHAPKWPAGGTLTLLVLVLVLGLACGVADAADGGGQERVAIAEPWSGWRRAVAASPVDQREREGAAQCDRQRQPDEAA